MAAKVVIKGETGDGGGEIAVAEQRLAFNREGIKKGAEGKERRCDLFVHASHCGGGAERSTEDGPKSTRRGEGGMNGAFLWVPGYAG